MIASVQYNDLRGTAAADVADEYMNSLQKYLMDTFSEYDPERYYCRGCTIWFDNRYTSIKFLCLDRIKEKFVAFRLQKAYSPEEIISLFKRLEVVMGIDVSEIEIDEDETIELK